MPYLSLKGGEIETEQDNKDTNSKGEARITNSRTIIMLLRTKRKNYNTMSLLAFKLFHTYKNLSCKLIAQK